jgi:hypothetical protein
VKALLAAAAILGFAGAAAACPFQSTKAPDTTAETVLPKPNPTAGS